MSHFIFATDYYKEENLEKIIRDVMKNYKTSSILVTIIDMWRLHLITFEDMDNLCKGSYRGLY